MIVRKSQQFEWDCISLNQLRTDIDQDRTYDIPDENQDPLVILLAIETFNEHLKQLESKDNE